MRSKALTAKKHWKRLLKVMYSRGVLEKAKIDIENVGWESRREKGVGDIPEIHLFSYGCDDWDSAVVILNLESLLMTEKESSLWYSNDCKLSFIPKRFLELDFFCPLSWIKFLKAYPKVKLNKKYNPKRLMRMENL